MEIGNFASRPGGEGERLRRALLIVVVGGKKSHLVTHTEREREREREAETPEKKRDLGHRFTCWQIVC